MPRKHISVSPDKVHGIFFFPQNICPPWLSLFHQKALTEFVDFQAFFPLAEEKKKIFSAGQIFNEWSDN